MAAGAGGGDGLNRIDWPLWIDHRDQTERQVLLARIDVAEGTVLRIGGRTGRAQRREQSTRKVVMAASEANHDIGPVEGLHIDAVVDAMHQQVEIDSLRWRCP